MRGDVTTWRKMLAKKGVTEWVAVAPNESVLDVEFDSGYGHEQGPPFVVWTETDVWFPVCYDGAEWPDRAPRNPVEHGQEHVGR